MLRVRELVESATDIMATGGKKGEATHAHSLPSGGIIIKQLIPLIANVKFSGILDHLFDIL